MRTKLLIILLTALIFSLTPHISSFAQTNTQAPNSEEATGPIKKDGNLEWKYSLSKFVARAEPLFLRNAFSEYSISIPISNRIKASQVSLHLEFTNSISLLAGRSQLSVLVDNLVVAQIPLKPDQPNSFTDLSLPANLFDPGYHTLKFQVAQHYTLQCEDPSAAELWTQIDLVRSKLTLTAQPTTLNPTLAKLGELIDEKTWGTSKTSILTTDKIEDTHLLWGSLVSQAVSLRLKYKPLELEHLIAKTKAASPQEGNFPTLDESNLTSDSILIGTQSEIAPYVSKTILEKAKSPFIGIFPRDNDQTAFLIVISGEKKEDVTLAAKAFAFINFPFPENNSLTLTQAEIPSFPDYAKEKSVHQNAKYYFSDFGMQTTTLKGLNSGNLSIQFNFPPDLFAHESAAVELSVHTSYNAGLRQDSTLGVFLNDRFESSIHLEKSGGDVFKGYKIYIPLRDFRPGINTLSFASKMLPLVTGNCQAIQTENLQISIFQDSYIVIPNAAHYAKMPDLQLFSASAFPHTIKPDGSSLVLHVVNNDPKTIAASWMLMGKLAQIVSVPLHQATISFTNPNNSKYLIVVGDLKSLDKNLLANSPIALDKMSYTQPIIFHPDAGENSLLESLYKRATNLFTTQENLPEPLVVKLSGNGGLGNYTLMTEFQGSYSTVLALTADNTEQLYKGIRSLTNNEIWGQLRGDLCVWQEDAKSFRAEQTGKAYFIGSLGVSNYLSFHFSKSPFFLITTLVVTIILLALLTRFLLKRYQARTHNLN